MKKKLLAGAITLLSVATLAACSNSSEGADLITMKGDVITEHQFYEEVKNNSTAQQVLLNMTIQKVFEKQYGSEVSEKEVDDAVAEEQKKYGDSYQIVLSRAGMTAESRKAQIRTSKLVEYAVKKAAEAELTDENYKKAYDEYTPDVTAQIIKLDSEDKAKEVLAKAKESGADFAQLAKDNSTDEKTKANGGEITFDSASTELPDVVKKAAFALDVDGISDVITAPGTQAYSSSFYIVKLTKKTEKSSNWEDYKDKLKTIILTQKQNDATFVQGVISKELQAANIKVKDQAFQNIFTQYIQSDSTTETTTTSSNWEDYKEKLKTVILTQKQNDATFVQGVISKELQAANIKVKDQAFQNIFTQYIQSDTTTTSAATETTTTSSN